jgi:DNA mismatch repair protein MutS
MDHVEAGILDLVARLYPAVFEELDDFWERYQDFPDKILTRFDREIQFYLAYLEYLAPLRAAGLSFCYPVMSAGPEEVSAADTFDIALASKLVTGRTPVVCNDLHLAKNQRLLVITGPNQGGKTTFARAFGQLHYLAGIGCLVPGREARLGLAGSLLTHFEREEDLSNLSGKLQDDLRRVHLILRQAASGSVIILNEIFTSTTPADAVYLSTKILQEITRLGALCLCVTFLDELASFSPDTVSMVSMVVPENPALRTFKIVQRPADGFAYAAAIAEKYGLTYDKVKARVTA